MRREGALPTGRAGLACSSWLRAACAARWIYWVRWQHRMGLDSLGLWGTKTNKVALLSLATGLKAGRCARAWASAVTRVRYLRHLPLPCVSLQLEVIARCAHKEHRYSASCSARISVAAAVKVQKCVQALKEGRGAAHQVPARVAGVCDGSCSRNAHGVARGEAFGCVRLRGGACIPLQRGLWCQGLS